MPPNHRSSAALAAAASLCSAGQTLAQAPIEYGFLWHMHQPIYVPYLTPPQVDATGLFSFDVRDVHNQRVGPYRSWPRNAIQAGLGLPNLGAQVSFSGSLIENLDAMSFAAPWNWSNWSSDYAAARNWNTALGNPRFDLVNFGYHHPLMPLLDERDIRMQLRLHRIKQQQTFGGTPSKGIFPPETAFHKRIIPALEAEGIEWALVDNIHFDRACINYPHNDAAGIAAPNRADQVNPDPAANGGAWVQLQNLWAPTRVSAPFGYQPAWVEWVDPYADPANLQPGDVSRIIAVPAARYEGNEDGRGGFGALQYEQVMDQYRRFNTDPDHPMFVLLHHDGDNFGGGSESYYGGNYQNFVNWVGSNPNYNASTAQDYLDRFPVPDDYVVHVENGSWAGADNGDPEFKKWLGDPDPNTGWSPDRNSWAVLTAAKNHVYTADDLSPVGQTDASRDRIIAGNGNAVERAWHTLLQAQASDHWYWDGTEVWDSNVTKGSNA
ncbi:MAG: glycosyl hydrolase family 57, partial [Planctomycetota bacterium]